ncbi:MAG: hypothetical protein IPO27_02870 [Bacteroidetes bacterium]|nr:hypothetical protein [Bacteroidota bacterium]
MVAQFKAATIPETKCTKSVGPTPNYPYVYQTSNDILITNVLGILTEMDLVVWAGNPGSMFWKYSTPGNSYFDILDLPVNITEADVALIQRNNIWFALIAYLNGTTPMLLVEQFNPGNQTWTQVSNTALGNGTACQTGIHIDSDQQEHFFIVFDQINAQGQQKIFGAAGTFWNNSITLCMTNYEFPIFNDPTGTYTIDPPYYTPDVAIMDVPTIAGQQFSNPGKVKITFMAPTIGNPNSISQICVSNDLVFSQYQNCAFTGPSVNLEYLKLATGSNVFSHPRIARNRRNLSISNVQEGYTVVWVGQDLQDFNIYGHTVFYDYVTQPGPWPKILKTDNTYTDGSCYFHGSISDVLPDISTYQKSQPVVSYERKSGLVNPNSGQIMCIGFNYSDPNTNNWKSACFYADNSDGRPVKTTFFNNYEYYTIQQNISGNNFGISITGELSESFIYSWMKQPTQPTGEAYYKVVTSGADLRMIGSNNNYTEEMKSIVIADDNFLPIELNSVTKIITWIGAQGEIYAANCGAEILDNKIPKGLSFIYYLNKNGQSERVKILKL